MDFKGITWAGNIYHKLEEMCLEVEEVIYEDTAKYVENQVQKVGVTVKKLYAEIMQDFLPSDHVKKAAGDLPLKPCAQADKNKKLKSDKLSIRTELDKNETTEEDISVLSAEESSLNVCSESNDANHFSPLSPRVTVENTCSEKNKKMGIRKLPIGIKRISKNNRPSKISRSSSSSSSSLMYDMESNYLVASGDMNVMRSSQFYVRNDRGEAVPKHTPISHASVKSFSSNQDLSAERKEKNEPQSTSRASDKSLSDESSKQKRDDSGCNSSCHGLPTEPIETSRKDGSVSQIKSNIRSSRCEVELEGEEVIVSYEDSFNIEVIETEEEDDVEKSNLEESCILVEFDKLHCVPLETKTHKSYKKMICEALSSKLRSTGKQYKDLGLGDEKEATKAHHPCESDWELL